MTAQLHVVLDELRNLILRMCPRAVASVSAKDRLAEDLGYDSLALIELAVAIEDRFDVPGITEEEAIQIKTVGDLERFVANPGGSAIK